MRRFGRGVCSPAPCVCPQSTRNSASCRWSATSVGCTARAVRIPRSKGPCGSTTRCQSLPCIRARSCTRRSTGTWCRPTARRGSHARAPRADHAPWLLGACAAPCRGGRAARRAARGPLSVPGGSALPARRPRDHRDTAAPAPECARGRVGLPARAARLAQAVRDDPGRVSRQQCRRERDPLAETKGQLCAARS